MSILKEIEELKQALSASPENLYLIKMLIAKMISVSDFNEDLESLLQRAVRLDPEDIDIKGQMIQLYYHQNKRTTCIVIADELKEKVYSLSAETRAMIAKCYLKDGDQEHASTLYQSVINDQPDFEDAELDGIFRIKNISTSEHESEDDGSLFTKPDINFDDVGGMDKVKREIDLKIIKPLENADLYASYGKKIGGGILLYGPPGCGKTFIAKATAGEINANFINISLTDILDMWIGSSERNLNRYFELARSRTPCVIFIDEVDALGAKRSDLKESSGRNVINQFLAELDGIASENEGILVIGATNAPWHLDAAFRRPGRFDRIIFVPPPDIESKEAIIKLKLKGKPQRDINYATIAKQTVNYSGADLNAIIDIAIENILEDAMQTGVPKPITTKDLLNASKKHNASTLEWFTTAKNYAMFANKSGIYDDILKYLK